jgi:hypothetical protein
MRSRFYALLMVPWSAAMAVASSHHAVSAATEVTCFDAEVSASIVRQTPTITPGGENCLIMRWPWIVDLRIQRVHASEVRRGPLTVLTLEHVNIPPTSARRAGC